MAQDSLLKEYRDLEMKVLNQLRTKIENSDLESDFVHSKAVKIDFNDMGEMVIVNDRVTFLDYWGNHNSVLNYPLEELIGLI